MQPAREREGGEGKVEKGRRSGGKERRKCHVGMKIQRCWYTAEEHNSLHVGRRGGRGLGMPYGQRTACFVCRHVPLGNWLRAVSWYQEYTRTHSCADVIDSLHNTSTPFKLYCAQDLSQTMHHTLVRVGSCEE